ncbi:MAG TPA: trypsin-like peptidase domain-containing protein [Candidatus Acidoferrales bacterium]|nr:trypsin-like peptidase domain-containing protein [Candidatus Acidoferrales bacterium]
MGIEFRELFRWAGRRKMAASLLFLATLCIGIVIGTLVSGKAMAVHEQAANGATLLAIPAPATLSNGFAAISKRVEPAVVNISTIQVIERPKSNRSSRRPGDPLGDFFDHFLNSPDDTPDAERSLGSGVIVDKNGFVLTNNHVVDQATKIMVSIDGDPTPYTARVIGTDKDTDLAVIKIDANRELPVAKLGNSDGVQVGDWVLAFGSPFGLSSTVTAGIVSAKDRSMENDGRASHQFQRFIQTDAAINPGNSGGPLVSLAGEVVGIDTAIYTGSRGFEGVGFALPSNVAISVYNDLVAHGKVVRGAIGVRFQDSTHPNPVLMRELGAPYGIEVEDVTPGSPAAKVGLQPGDVITKVNGHPIHTGADLVDPIAQTPVGKSIDIEFVRNRQTKQVSAVVEDRSKISPEESSTQTESQPAETPSSRLGLHVEDLTPDLARKLGMAKPGSPSKSAGAIASMGVVVTEVDPATFADESLFYRGDVITEINRVPISSMADYSREVAKLQPGKDVLFKVARHLPDEDRTLTVYLAGVVPAK